MPKWILFLLGLGLGIALAAAPGILRRAGSRTVVFEERLDLREAGLDGACTGNTIAIIGPGTVATAREQGGLEIVTIEIAIPRRNLVAREGAPLDRRKAQCVGVPRPGEKCGGE